MRKTTAVLVAILFAVGHPLPASAHTLLRDGTIGVELHVEPGDSPIVDQPSKFYLEISDQTGRFKPELCDCNLSMTQEGTTILSQPVFQNQVADNLSTPDATYTFAKADTYTLTVTGRPKQAGAFDAFTVNFPLTVTRQYHPGLSWRAWLIVVMDGVVVIGLAWYIWRHRRKRRRS